MSDLWEKASSAAGKATCSADIVKGGAAHAGDLVVLGLRPRLIHRRDGLAPGLHITASTLLSGRLCSELQQLPHSCSTGPGAELQGRPAIGMRHGLAVQQA